MPACEFCLDTGTKEVPGEMGYVEVTCWCPAGRKVQHEQQQQLADSRARDRELLRRSNR